MVENARNAMVFYKRLFVFISIPFLGLGEVIDARDLTFQSAASTHRPGDSATSLHCLSQVAMCLAARLVPS